MSIARLPIALVVLASILYPQSERGNINGIITDPAGAAIASARISVIHRDTSVATNIVSNESGEFNAANLLPGTYRVEISAPGFKRQVQDSIVVATSSSVRLDAQLQLGQVSETVEVSSTTPQVQTDNAKVSTHVQNKLVDELPLVVGGAMRSPFNLVAVAAEARGDGQRMSWAAGRSRHGMQLSTGTRSAPIDRRIRPKLRSTHHPSKR
jgi:hypothetical protein